MLLTSLFRNCDCNHHLLGPSSTSYPYTRGIQHSAISIPMELGSIHYRSIFFHWNFSFHWTSFCRCKFGILDYQPSCIPRTNCHNSLHAGALFWCWSWVGNNTKGIGRNNWIDSSLKLCHKIAIKRRRSLRARYEDSIDFSTLLDVAIGTLNL